MFNSCGETAVAYSSNNGADSLAFLNCKRDNESASTLYLPGIYLALKNTLLLPGI